MKKAISSLLNTELNIKLFLVDNSPEDELKVLSDFNSRIEYIFTGKNLGYGKANNLIINRVLSETEYHLVMNPDVYFEKGTLEALYSFMQANDDIGLCMPRVCHYDGSEQKLCKLLSTPRDLIIRRFIPDGKYKDKISRIYNMWGADYDKQMDVPFLSGCFMFLRVETIAKHNFYFDERFFMYCEDLDLSRRINQISKNMYYPAVSIIHNHEKGSYKSKKLMMCHIKSTCKYFCKWGWVFDAERRRINKQLR